MYKLIFEDNIDFKLDENTWDRYNQISDKIDLLMEKIKERKKIKNQYNQNQHL